MQYPEWLASHRDSLSREDCTRYGKQMEVMAAICSEFEKPPEQNEGTSDKILQLMQELQRYGQPPEDLAGDVVSYNSVSKENDECPNLSY